MNDIAKHPETRSVNKPLVSIGMPVYNGEKFIREALDSLLAQTFTDFELIISDNASTDDTEVICREYAAKDKRIRYVRQAQNMGATANFKWVLQQAVGEYFMWAAADDRWDKNWLSTLLPISSTGQCIAFGTLQTIDGNGNQMQHFANGRRVSYAGSRFIRRLKYYFEPAFFGKSNCIYGIYPKNLLSSDLFCIELLSKRGGDLLLMYHLLDLVEINGGHAVFFYKRIHNDCASVQMMGKELLNKKFLWKISNYVNNLIGFRFKMLIEYMLISNVVERNVQALLLPFAIIWDISEAIRNNPRFAKK